MIGARATLFAVSFLGVLYALLSVMTGSNGDAIGGMVVAAVGIAGWGLIDWWEETR